MLKNTVKNFRRYAPNPGRPLLRTEHDSWHEGHGPHGLRVVSIPGARYPPGGDPAHQWPGAPAKLLENNSHNAFTTSIKTLCEGSVSKIRRIAQKTICLTNGSWTLRKLYRTKAQLTMQQRPARLPRFCINHGFLSASSEPHRASSRDIICLAKESAP